MTRWKDRGEGFEIVGGDRSRFDITEEWQKAEGELITKTLASLVAGAEKEGRADVAAWLRDRVVNGRDHTGAWPHV